VVVGKLAELAFVLETDREPPAELVERVASDCDLPRDALTFILTPTTSLAGAVQITARVLEVALHKVHALGFPLGRVRDGLGAAPLPPPSPKKMKAASGGAMPSAPAAAAPMEERSDVEQAVLGHGPNLGPYNEGRGLRLVRDPKFPVRVTVQFYKATSNGVVNEADLDAIAKSIGRSTRPALNRVPDTVSVCRPTGRSMGRSPPWSATDGVTR